MRSDKAGASSAAAAAADAPAAAADAPAEGWGFVMFRNCSQ